jgi:hypothetical protein
MPTQAESDTGQPRHPLGHRDRPVHDQAQALTDPALRRIYLDYDRAHDLDTRDPRLDDLARRIVAATKSRYGPARIWRPVRRGPPDPASSEMADTERLRLVRLAVSPGCGGFR